MDDTRSNWIRALMTHPMPDIFRLRDRCTGHLEVHHLRSAESGLSLLQLRETALGQRYYLGEFPLSVARVELRSSDGRTGEGAAQVMDDNVELASALAILDGVLANRLDGHEEVASFIREGLARLNRERRIREGMLARTRVDFSLLSTVEESDA